MASTSLIKLEINIPKAKFKKLKSFLDKQGVEITSQNKKKNPDGLTSAITRGNYKAGEKPSDFSGIWKDDDRDIEEMRRKAWDNRGIKW